MPSRKPDTMMKCPKCKENIEIVFDGMHTTDYFTLKYSGVCHECWIKQTPSEEMKTLVLNRQLATERLAVWLFHYLKGGSWSSLVKAERECYLRRAAAAIKQMEGK